MIKITLQFRLIQLLNRRRHLLPANWPSSKYLPRASQPRASDFSLPSTSITNVDPATTLLASRLTTRPSAPDPRIDEGSTSNRSAAASSARPFSATRVRTPHGLADPRSSSCPCSRIEGTASRHDIHRIARPTSRAFSPRYTPPPTRSRREALALSYPQPSQWRQENCNKK